MLALYIVSSIIVIAAILLFSPVSIIWQYDDKTAKVTAKYLFFKIPLLPAKQKEATKSTTKKRKSFLKDYYKKHGFASTAKEVCSIASETIKRAVWLFKRLKFTDVRLDIKVAGENAAYTALEYGATCAAVYSAVAFLSSVASVDIKQFDITADFDAGDWRITTSGKGRFKLVWGISTGIKIIITLVKSEMFNIKPEQREGANNER